MSVDERPVESDQFDPRRHKLFRVTVSFEDYEVVVAAASEGEAIRIARNGDHCPDPDYDADLIESAPFGLLSGTVLEGPSRWGRRTLTIREALKLVANPPTPEEVPAPPGETKLVHLTDSEWLALATDTEAMGQHSVLRGVYVEAGEANASNGHRLHRVSGVDMPPGLRDPLTGEPIGGRYPDCTQVLSTGPATHEMDVEAAGPVIQQALPSGRVVRLTEVAGNSVVVNSDYLADALLGAVTADGVVSGVRLAITGALSPIRFDMPEIKRSVALMPVRVHGQTAPDADLSAFLRPVSGEEGR